MARPSITQSDLRDAIVEVEDYRGNDVDRYDVDATETEGYVALAHYCMRMAARSSWDDGFRDYEDDFREAVGDMADLYAELQ